MKRLASRLSRVSDVFAPLRDCLDRSSVVGRHALRYELVVAAGMAIDKGFDPPFGYWIPLTVSVVLKPYAGSTLTRAGQRLFGTGAGIAVGVGIMAFATTASARAVLASAAIFLTLAVLPLNYGLAIFFLSVGIVPLEAQLVGAVGPEVELLRIGPFMELSGFTRTATRPMDGTASLSNSNPFALSCGSK